ncbi:MAG: transcriptional repressor LexA [Rhodospirillales bacterium]|jgi:repressor LexA|nr:transcriptional repressor LexA [Rhodospirillales bacterium]
MLTRKQYELLVFITDTLKTKGVSPSFEEMKDALGLRSKSGIHRLITGLEERGFISHLPHRARALEVLRLPENMNASGKGVRETQAEFAPSVIKGDFKRRPAAEIHPAADAVELPLYGQIAAGLPIEAVSDNTNTVDVPASLLGSGEHYALHVDGDSMIDAGINDGDTVVLERCDTAENGTIVVALVEDTEVTLKRLRKRGDSIALEPANQSYETRIFGPDQVQVQGKLVGLIRKY